MLIVWLIKMILSVAIRKKFLILPSRNKDNLNTTNINRAIDLLTQPMSKFFRFYIPVLYFVDVMLQHIYCINYRYGNVLICILPTGRTQNLVEQAKVAKANDAIIITITTANSSLAQIASLSIAITVPEYTNIYLPMVSRLAQLTLGHLEKPKPSLILLIKLSEAGLLS
ncbi:SIS domain-containing protein [Arsenophonus sp. ENCA]|uniref:SIS domain-containing protein n=1 Tax=Arsenophonus sp. ENCA TaxID=1987579 RepID=UPI0025B964AE|nr:SIS domain-containing protein [Arsenophonus sp. ENCA]